MSTIPRIMRRSHRCVVKGLPVRAEKGLDSATRPVTVKKPFEVCPRCGVRIIRNRPARFCEKYER
jgi:hypothetical protein